MEHEQRDPFAQKDTEEVRIVCSIETRAIIFVFVFQLSDWDRYAAQEYELLVAEESNDGAG